MSLRPDPAKEDAGDVVVVRLNEDGHEIVAVGDQSEIISYEESTLHARGNDRSHIERAVREPNLAAQLAGLVAGLAEDGWRGSSVRTRVKVLSRGL